MVCRLPEKKIINFIHFNGDKTMQIVESVLLMQTIAKEMQMYH